MQCQKSCFSSITPLILAPEAPDLDHSIPLTKAHLWPKFGADPSPMTYCDAVPKILFFVNYATNTGPRGPRPGPFNSSHQGASVTKNRDVAIKGLR
jgi:hypothetical protein